MSDPTLEPKPGFQFVEVPDDIQKAAITSQAVSTLCRLDGGDSIAGLDDDMRELTAACLTLGKKGKITITIDVEPAGVGRLAWALKCSAKIPKPDSKKQVLFATATGQVLARDPAQPDLPGLRVVDVRPITPAREVTV